MGPCGAAISSLRMMSKGMNATDAIVRNNPLRKSRRQYPTARKIRKIKIKIDGKLRSKAHNLSKKAKKSSFNWQVFFWTFVVCLFLIAFFSNYWIYLLSALLIFTVLKVIYDAFALGIYSKKISVKNNLRQAKIEKNGNSTEKASRPGDYYVI